MAYEIIMPKAGIDMTEGQVVKWLKKEGDPVKEGEIILEIMTDKTSMEIEAEASGILLKIVHPDGDTVPVTEVIGYIGSENESVDTLMPEVIEDTGEKESEEDKRMIRLEDNYNVVVIGGGPAGYVAAIKAAQLGARVAIVEKGEFGGTCLNVGCIPTKAYLKNAEIIEHIREASTRGILIDSSQIKVDMEKVQEYKNGVVKKLTSGVVALLKSNGVDIYQGVGKINKNKDVVVNDSQIIKADKIILAGGSKASRINIPGIESDKVLTSDDLLAIKEVPETLAVIGGGVIGTEMGQSFAGLGSKVIIIEMMDRIVPPLDHEVSAELTRIVKKKGMTIITSARITEIVDKGDKLEIKIDGKDSVIADKALISIGRVPDLEGMGEVKFETERGKIKVDKYMETSVKGIYAPGDVNGIKMLAHVAFRMGEVAAENAVKGNHRSIKLLSAPSVVYTSPEVAMVGLTEEEARAKYDDIRIGRFNFAANGRALASSEAHGFVKVIADNRYGEVLGVHIIGPSAAEIITQASLIMEMEITVDEVIKTIYGHPTYSEALFEAFADILDEAVHIPKKKK
ncbi:dihydrolipoamide dehydrogenase [Proteiniphilum saccharofermentans]|uniref:Dihydrolipoyl dehydrogenase n=1 Tax=Proteiniphilum saccharofermentans TaxID=1642647 RepID=A0A1R3T7I4_9BACT|nr:MULTISPECIES: dihydrolipoyl dehydrogenase [Proteiniphilum]MDY9918745.1 dihydrolipoyl dehydrogenase [Proteiniphilum sp.]SCD21248.1 dihydrolipoamide dehydrogenase [Proteiniphilum saccharofermentans]